MAWRWLLVACSSSVKNHNVSRPHLFPSFTTHAGKIPLPPLGRSYSEQKNHFAIGRNSERCYYNTDLSRFVLPISDPLALNFSKFVGLQNSQNLCKIRCYGNERIQMSASILFVLCARPRPATCNTPECIRNFSKKKKFFRVHPSCWVQLNSKQKCKKIWSKFGARKILEFSQLNSNFETISQRLAFAFRSPARALAAALPRQDHVYQTTDESFRFHNKKFDEIRCKLDSTENPRSFEN